MVLLGVGALTVGRLRRDRVNQRAGEKVLRKFAIYKLMQ